jgi:glycosyltransferase involved in cell wall biosynthesis
MKKILSLVAYFPPEIVAGNHLSMDLFEALIKRGYQVNLYVPSPTRGINQKIKEEYRKRKNETMFNGNLYIHRFPLFQERKSPFQRATRYIISCFLHLFWGLRDKDADFIFVSSTPPIIGIVGALLHKLKRIPFIYVVQDIFPDSLVNTGLSYKGSLAWKVGRIIENFSYRNATRIIVISESFRQNLLMKQVPEDKIKVIPNWIDTKQVFPVSRENNMLFKKFSLDPKNFYITYCGNIGHTQNLNLLLKVAKRLESISDIMIVLLGDGAYLSELLQEIEMKRLSNIHHFPFQPYEDIALVYSLGDVGLIISKEGIASNSVPSKTWSIMAAARPVLASFDLKSMLGEVIQETNCGKIVPANDEQSLYEAMVEMYEKRETLSEIGERGLEYVKTVLDKDVCTKKYVDVINSIRSTD